MHTYLFDPGEHDLAASCARTRRQVERPGEGPQGDDRSQAGGPQGDSPQRSGPQGHGLQGQGEVQSQVQGQGRGFGCGAEAQAGRAWDPVQLSPGKPLGVSGSVTALPALGVAAAPIPEPSHAGAESGRCGQGVEGDQGGPEGLACRAWGRLAQGSLLPCSPGQRRSSMYGMSHAVNAISMAAGRQNSMSGSAMRHGTTGGPPAAPVVPAQRRSSMVAAMPATEVRPWAPTCARRFL
jgi:hypothetical protein